MNIKKKYIVLIGLIGFIVACRGVYAQTPRPLTKGNLVHEEIFSSREDMDQLQKEIDLKNLAEKDLSIEVVSEEPQILIIHSHPYETYKVDELKDKSGSVIDVGNELKRILESQYKVSVMHYNEGGREPLTIGAYERVETIVKDILKKNPSIQVIIDIHRDGGAEPTALLMKGISTAQINIVNGLSMDEKVGVIGSLKAYPNPYIKDNLSFSVQIKINSDRVYPELVKKVYLNNGRYSLHLLPKSLLVDIGNNEDTLDEAVSALQPFAEILAETLSLKGIE